MSIDLYRVEDATGHGPYRGTTVASWRYMRHWPDNDARHPTPGEDGGTYPPPFEHGRFGFASLAQLAAWFDPEQRAYLAAHGFTVKRYTVTGPCVALKHQSIAAHDGLRDPVTVAWDDITGGHNTPHKSMAWAGVLEGMAEMRIDPQEAQEVLQEAVAEHDKGALRFVGLA